MSERPLSEIRIADPVRPHRLIAKRLGEDVTQEVVLANGQSNPSGWSQYELIHNQVVYGAILSTRIGWLYCGYPSNILPDYTVEVIPDNA